MAVEKLTLATEPLFPISVHFQETGVIVNYENVEDLVTALEWFDSTDPGEAASVNDCKGRSVRLLITKLKMMEFSLI